MNLHVDPVGKSQCKIEVPAFKFGQLIIMVTKLDLNFLYGFSHNGECI